MYVVQVGTLNIRRGFTSDSPVVGQYHAGDEVLFLCLVEVSEGDWWGNTKRCFASPDFNEWSAVQINGFDFMKEKEGPVGF